MCKENCDNQRSKLESMRHHFDIYCIGQTYFLHIFVLLFQGYKYYENVSKEDVHSNVISSKPSTRCLRKWIHHSDLHTLEPGLQSIRRSCWCRSRTWWTRSSRCFPCLPTIWFFPNESKTDNRNIIVQWPPLIRMISGQHKTDNNNRMIKLTDAYCLLFRYKIGPAISDYCQLLILLSVIQLSGGECSFIFNFQC